ncbi:hypothetical protein ACFVP3_23455 [Streptomyces sp. NPDC057806]|uniref:hypothetical protein n=1 Tax=Streptomyces sp. NPDC057806 TaxID=3346255 RepID=UPI0036AF9042
MNRRITVAEYLVRRGLPADWPYGSPLGRVAASLYRQTYGREPRRAWRFINGRFRQVMTYAPGEQHVLTRAWEQYGCTAGRRTAPAARPVRPTAVWLPSGDAMRWVPAAGPVRAHP